MGEHDAPDSMGSLADDLHEGVTDPEVSMAGSPVGLPQMVGPFHIVRLLGSGGMGSVYEATQVHPDRRVALKILRVSASDPESRKRFAREANLLGRLTHPNIAQIHAAGSFEDDGVERPYFAMEFVEGGSTLTDFAQREGLSLRSKLEVFLDICDAIEAGHRLGVIHRDLKPDNILVSGTASAPRVKVIDFGVARVSGGDLPAESLQTQVGQIIGTLHYMSPEQIQADPDRIDQRADVYSLGVVLFELVSGHLPYELTGLPILEQVRIIQQGVPERLSTTQRGLRGDLDTITAKALEKERGRRYASVAAFADDLRAYLAGRPISARPASAVYKLRKFAERNKAVFLSLVALFVVLVGATAASVRWALIAERQVQASDRTTEFVVGLFTSADPQVSRDANTTARDILAAGTERLEALDDEPEVQAKLRKTLGAVQVDLGLPHEGRALLEQVVGYYRERALSREEELDLAATLLSLGSVEEYLGLADQALEHIREGVALQERHMKEGVRVARGYGHLGNAFAALGRLEEAEEAYRRSLELLAGALGQDNPEYGGVTHNLGNLQLARGDYAGAEATFLGALERAGHPRDTRDYKGGAILCSLAEAHLRQGQVEEAIQRAREAREAFSALLPPEHPDHFAPAVLLAQAYLAAGEHSLAEEKALEALEVAERVYGAEDPRTLDVETCLAAVWNALGQHERVVSHVESILVTTGARELRGPRMYLLFELGRARRGMGELEAAALAFEEVLELADTEGGPSAEQIAARAREELTEVERMLDE